MVNGCCGKTSPVSAGTAAVQLGAIPESINVAFILSLFPQTSCAKTVKVKSGASR